MNDRFAKGGFVLDEGVTVVRVERVGHCAYGHDQYRINGSNYVEHVADKGHLDEIDCPHSVEWRPKG